MIRFVGGVFKEKNFGGGGGSGKGVVSVDAGGV